MHIGLVTILVPDYDEGIRFFLDGVGFSLAEDTDLGEGKRWVVVSPGEPFATSLLLAQADGPNQAAAIGRAAGGRVGFFLMSDDFAGRHARMVAGGVQFLEDPREEPYGIVAVWRDPWGNLWDLLEPRRTA